MNVGYYVNTYIKIIIFILFQIETMSSNRGRAASRGQGRTRPSNRAGRGAQHNQVGHARAGHAVLNREQQALDDVDYVPEGALEEENEMIAIESGAQPSRQAQRPQTGNPPTSTCTPGRVLNVANENRSSVPEDAICIPENKKTKWPSYREEFYEDWKELSRTGQVFGTCKSCGKTVIANVNAFSNFIRHLDIAHKAEWTAHRSKTSTGVVQTKMGDYLKPKVNNSLAAKLDRFCGIMIIRDNLPFTFVRKQGFRDFLKVNALIR